MRRYAVKIRSAGELIVRDQWFYETREDADRAARSLRGESPDSEVVVVPVTRREEYRRDA